MMVMMGGHRTTRRFGMLYRNNCYNITFRLPTGCRSWSSPTSWGRIRRARQPMREPIWTEGSSLYWLRDVLGVNAGRQRRSQSELTTTETEDSAIAAPASVGVRNPSAARGIPTTL
jgi:hypothetical protein